MDTNNSSCNNSVNLNGFADTELWEEVQVPVPWGIISGKWWGSRDRQPILALHGWQDNAGTFDTLIPLLSKQHSYYSIDLPGHGKSSHYPKGMQYYLFWDGISLIRRIVQYFQWDNIILMGHSLGGGLSFMYASVFPKDVNKMISLDIAGPTIRDQRKLAAITGEQIDRLLKYEKLSITKMPCYTYDEMIDLVVDAYEGSVDRNGARILMRRGMASAPESLHKNGYHFARDLRLKVAVLGAFSLEQCLCYAEQIKCKVLNIRAVPGKVFDNFNVYPLVIETLRENAEYVRYEEVSGTHHVHLVDPEQIAHIIDDFLEY